MSGIPPELHGERAGAEGFPGPGTPEQGVPVARWAWILLLLDAAERAGLTPIETPRLHRLAYFANCLAPVYDLPVADGKIMKFVRGPFYPDLQWDTDRLVAMGLVELRTFEPFRDTQGWWFSASYVMPPAGVATIATILESPRLARVYEFQLELAAAFSDLPEDVQHTSGERDATYADPKVPEGALIDFADWDRRNFTDKAADLLASHAPANLRLGQRDRIHLYFRYLRRVDPLLMSGEETSMQARAAG